MKKLHHSGLIAALLVSTALSASAAPTAEPAPTGPINVHGLTFESWNEYANSDYFKATGARCGTLERHERPWLPPQADFLSLGGGGADCTDSSTNPSSDYDPNTLYEVKVVVHILMDNNCDQGAISDQTVFDQIDVLNEDFLALAGSNGANGNDAQVRFVLADTDPQGQPTTGITRDCNTTWFNDGGGYWNTLAWDPNTYMNIYTNRAGGNLGYVPFLPNNNGSVGSDSDRVVMLWTTFGKDGPIGFPYNLGRTTTHEVGHYLGLEHTFASGGCPTGSAPGCYSSGDLICDTNSESSPQFDCDPTVSCGSQDPIDNYMDYSWDQCMEQFTGEQLRRMRCTMAAWRPGIFQVVDGVLFEDDFEDGTSDAWVTVPAP